MLSIMTIPHIPEPHRGIPAPLTQIVSYFLAVSGSSFPLKIKATNGSIPKGDVASQQRLEECDDKYAIIKGLL